MVDANILYAGSVWRRWPYEVLRHALKKDFHLVLCPKVILEAREGIAADYPASSQAFERLLAALPYELVNDPSPRHVAKHATLLPDPEDVPIALAAITARVDYFVSEDKHFTVRKGATEQFHKKVRVMLSGTFLREVMGWTHDDLEKVKART
jgi:predicted nucleic acid-binding protein